MQAPGRFAERSGARVELTYRRVTPAYGVVGLDRMPMREYEALLTGARGTAFVVELAAGPLSTAAAARFAHGLDVLAHLR